MTSREATIQAVIDQLTPDAVELYRPGIKPNLIIRCPGYPGILPISPQTLTLIHATPNLLARLNAIHPALTLEKLQAIIDTVILAPHVEGENCAYLLSKNLLLRLIAVGIIHSIPQPKTVANPSLNSSKWLWVFIISLILFLMIAWHRSR
jgi:hypothetical protein